MRRLLFAVLSAVALAGASVTIPALPAAGAPIEGFDAAVEVAGPDAIAPPGATATYTVTVSLTGLTAADIEVTNTADYGTVETGGCGAQCTVTLDPVLGPAEVDLTVNVTSDFTATAVVVTSTVTLRQGDEVVAEDLDSENDTRSHETTVVGTAYDASVTIGETLDEIAPAGSYGIYELTVSNGGPHGAAVTLTNAVAGGVIDPEYSDLGACDGTVTACNLTLSTGDNETIRLAVKSDTVETCGDASFADCVELTSTVGDSDPNTADTNTTNDSHSVTTPVDDPEEDNSAAFVPEGGSLTFEANGQTHVLTVTAAHGSGGGAIVEMSDPGLMNCDNDASSTTNDCYGVHIEFQLGAPGDPYHATTNVDSSGVHDPCRGLGTDSCTGIIWRKTAADDFAALPACGTETAGEPCLIRKFKSGSGVIHYLTEMQTDDPDLGLPSIPPPKL